jgi:hypothetical protein
LAYRRVVDDPVTGRDWFAEVWVLRGRHLVSARSQRDLRPPRAKPLIALTRQSLQALAK